MADTLAGQTAITAASIADEDLLWLVHMSAAVNTRDRKVTVDALRQALASSSSVTGGAYHVALGFVGSPTAGQIDWTLIGAAVTIIATEPGQAYARTAPTDGAWIATIQRNGASVGTIEVSTAGAVTWTIVSDITLAAGDRLELVAPNPADSTLADAQVLLAATLDA